MTRMMKHLGRLPSSATALALLLSAGLSMPAAAQDGRPVPKSYMNKTLVHLPIQLEPAARPQIQEVQLYVKDGPQAPWALKERAPATQTFFSYKAPHDGEYCFNVVTVEKSGRAVPADIHSEPPALVVVIDTVPPVADVHSLQDSPNGPQVQCEIRDANVDPIKTKFFYQTRNQVWQPLEPNAGTTDTFCIPVQAAFTGLVRVVAVDLAGNTASREINLGTGVPVNPAVAGGPPGMAPPGMAPPGMAPPGMAPPPLPNAPFANAPKPGASDVIIIDNPGHKGGVPNEVIIENVGQKFPAGTNPPPLMHAAEKPAPFSERVEVIGSKPVLPPQGSGPALENAGSKTPPLPFASEKPLAIEKPPVPVTPSGNHPSVVNAQPTNPQSANPSTINASQINGPTPNTTQPIAGPAANVPEPPAHRHLVNNTRVFLDYQIEQTGASGVGKVEIWFTRDNGQTWQKMGEDADRKSPAEIMLPSEGLFGVTLVVANGRGFGATPPKSGDTPEWWIEVDLTKPKAELTNVRSGQVEDGSLEVSWSAKDKNLADEPVDLFFANTRQGPWQPIAKGLKNDGLYRWTPGAELASHAFIRLVVRDMAGNSTTSETTQPIALDDLSRPRGRVLGISTAPKTILPPPPHAN